MDCYWISGITKDKAKSRGVKRETYKWITRKNVCLIKGAKIDMSQP